MGASEASADILYIAHISTLIMHAASIVQLDYRR